MTTTLLERIQAAYQRDIQSPKPLKDGSTLPISFEAITDEWLTGVLCADLPGAAVVSHRLGPVDTGTSNRRLIHVEYNTKGAAAALPSSLFCKATHDLLNRIVLGVAGGARGEALFYNRIRPSLDIEAPRSYFASFDEETFNSIVMLGDLGPMGTEFCDHKTVINKARACSQVELLAKLHGECYRNQKLREPLSALQSWPDFFGKTLDMGMKEGSNQGFLAAESVIPARLYRRYDAVWPATINSVDQHNRLPHTLAHGDVHLKNWYIAGSGQMGLSDWQCCGRGHWGRDFAYAVSTSLTVDARRAWDAELLRLYLDRLHAAGGPSVNFEEAWNHYRQQLMSALTWWTITLTPAPGMPDMQPRDTTLEFIKRISTAIDDLDALDSFK